MKNSEEIQKGNKTIAEYFLPNVEEEISSGKMTIDDNMWTKCCILAKDWGMLKYHKSWDAIVPVVRKIMDTKIEMEQESEIWYAYYSVETHLQVLDLDSLWEDVVEFISLLNQKK